MILQPIVEGKGEVIAVRELFTRLMTSAARFDFQVAHPIRRTVSQLINPAHLDLAVNLALNTEGVSAVIVLFDGDIPMHRPDQTYSNFCPKIDVPPLLERARTAARGVPCAVVVAIKEYEAWLLAGIEGVRGNCGIDLDAVCPNNHANVRDAKGAISDLMPNNASYSPTSHQVIFTNRFDVELAFKRSRSFRKLCKALVDLQAAVGQPLTDWPPQAWIDGVIPQ